jgi:hypothetical protein
MLLQYGLLTLVAYILIKILVLSSRIVGTPVHGHQHFRNNDYSVKALYEAIAIAVKEKNIPGLSLALVTHAEGGMFSMNRKYLRISRNRMIFDVCAAPFADIFFVSWWQAKLPSAREVFLQLIPFLGRTAVLRARERTYFEIDVDIMFRTVIQETITSTIAQMTSPQGFRELAPDAGNKSFSLA